MAGSLLSWQTSAPGAWVDETIALDIASASTSTVGSDPFRMEIETVYALRRTALIRFLVRFGVDASEAEDIAQESFLRAFREARRGRHPDNLLAWVTACAKNLAIDRWRKDRREVLVSSSLWEEWKGCLPSPEASCETGFYGLERRLWLIQALRSLDTTEQQCMALRSEGATFREIGEALRIAPRHAVYLTSKAVQKLRSTLNELSS